MAGGSQKRTTMAKLNREAALRERRQRKQAKKDARRQASADRSEQTATGTPAGEQTVPAD
jgi:hypothetical protein